MICFYVAAFWKYKYPRWVRKTGRQEIHMAFKPIHWRLICETCQIHTFTSQCHSIFIVCSVPLHRLPSFSSLSLLAFPSSWLSFCNVSLSVPSIALDVHHFLKTYTITSGEMCCPTMMLHWQRSSTLDLLILPAGVKAWFLVKSHSL